MSAQKVRERYKGIWSAGHGIGAIKTVRPMAAVIDEVVEEYERARSQLAARLAR